MNALSKFSLVIAGSYVFASLASAASFYPQPAPSNEEQYLLERINVARANPAAEGQMLASVTDSEILRYYSHYGVDTNALRSSFAGYAAMPPLAFNSDLMASSRQQSLDQATHGFQGHDSSDGTSFDVRIGRTGYAWHALGENVFAYVENPFFGHVGLNADWGVPSLDHRANIMNSDPSFPVYKEIGISYVATSAPGFGPYVMTEDFGTPSDASVAYLVGVVYNDGDASGSYTVGEGLGGVTISTDSGAYFTTTSASGGYVLPLPSTGSGTMTVTATGGPLGGAVHVKTISYVAGANVKADFTSQEASGPALPMLNITASSNLVTLGSAPSEVKIARSGELSQPLTVALYFKGTAIQGVDVNPLPSSVTIPAGSDSVSLSVQAAPVPAQSVATTKKIRVKLQQGAGYLVSPERQLARAAVQVWTAAN